MADPVQSAQRAPTSAPTEGAGTANFKNGMAGSVRSGAGGLSQKLQHAALVTPALFGNSAVLGTSTGLNLGAAAVKSPLAKGAAAMALGAVVGMALGINPALAALILPGVNKGVMRGVIPFPAFGASTILMTAGLGKAASSFAAKASGTARLPRF